MPDDITVVLNAYRRPQRLKEQYEAVTNQTIKPKEVLIWQNFFDETAQRFPKDIFDKCTTAICSKNLGVWSRFMYALNAKTKYICLFDDDSIPGNQWFQNCLETIKKFNGPLGSRGVIFKDPRNYSCNQGVGWETKNSSVEKVDIIGHVYFIERDWLRYYFYELPPEGIIPQFAGEDMQISFAVQKHLGLNTYIPIHPAENKEMWGSTKACEYGIGREATANFAIGEMNRYLQYIRSKGFKLINDAR